jgi:hypothetical protein
MEFDWCSENTNKPEILFNSESIIKKKIEVIGDTQKKNKNINTDLQIENCLTLNLNVTNREKLLEVLSYTSFVSNKLRGFIRQKNPFTVNSDVKITYAELVNYLNWIFDACETTKKNFVLKYRKDLPSDLDQVKLFKTSSYKFCNFRDGCLVHKNKTKNCDKNHFVFDMVLGDIKKLIESLKLIECSSGDHSNLLWILNDNILIFNKKTSEIKKFDYFNQNNLTEDEIFIDKNVVFKCFDVISYVLNKMYEEAYLFINYNIFSELILI